MTLDRLGNNPWVPPVESSLVELQLIYDNFTLRLKEIGENHYFTNVKLIDRDWGRDLDSLFIFIVLGSTKSKDLVIVVRGDLILNEQHDRILWGKIVCRIKSPELEAARKTTEKLVT